MPRNGSGTYVLPTGNPVAPGTVIESTWANDTMTDVGTALTGSLPRNGEAPMSAPLKLSDGTVSSPSLTFNSQTSTGVYWPGTGILALTAGGVEVFRVNSSGRLLLGSTSDTTERLQVTGTAKVTGNTTIGGTLGVIGAATLSSTLGVIGAATLAALSATTGSFSSTLAVTGATTLSSTLAVTGATTLSSTLSVTGNVAVNTNKFNVTAASGNTTIAGTLGVTGATTLSSTLSVTGATTLAGVLNVADGAAASPGITFTTDTNTGIYRVGENQLGLAAGAALRLTIGTTSITSTLPYYAPDGTAAAPSYAFSSDTNTGLYWVSADTLGITTAGTQAATFDASGNANIAGGLGVRAGVPATSYGIISSYDRTVNSSTYGLHSTVNLTAATLTADRSNYGIYNIIQVQNQNAAAFSANVFGIYSQAQTSTTAGNSVNGEGTLYGVYGYANHQTGDATYTRMENAFGVYGIAQSTGTTSLIDNAYGVYSLVRPTNAGATINTGYLFYGSNSTVTGAMTNRYGVYIASAINNYFTGAVQIGGTATGPTTAGGLGVGVDPPGDNLISAAGSITTGTQFFGAAADSVTAPSYTWSTDNNSGMYNAGADSIGFTTGGTNRVTISTTAVTVANADTVLANTGPTSTLSAGFRGVPQSSQSANYTLVLADAGKHVYHPSGGGAGDVFTIPANASVAFPVGTAVTFVNLDSNTVSIAITTDTLYMAGSGSTGSRTLAQYGIATALKISSTTWLISGTGLT